MLAKRTGPTARHQTSRRNYYRVLIAVYMSADSDAAITDATNKQLARLAGLSEKTISQHLRSIERGGDLAIYDAAQGWTTRLIVLLDHPDAPRLMRKMGPPRQSPSPRRASTKPEHAQAC